MRWEPKAVDYELSPYTGLTRDSWLEAAEYYKYQVLRSCTKLCPLYNAAAMARWRCCCGTAAADRCALKGLRGR